MIESCLLLHELRNNQDWECYLCITKIWECYLCITQGRPVAPFWQRDLFIQTLAFGKIRDNKLLKCILYYIVKSLRFITLFCTLAQFRKVINQSSWLKGQSSRRFCQNYPHCLLCRKCYFTETYHGDSDITLAKLPSIGLADEKN